jgi:succinyl-CoA synthetase beta subunit
MNIHEYQAKQLLAGFGVEVPKGGVALSAGDIDRAVAATDGPVWVVKAQIHAGGRGKGGGVKVVRSAEDAASTARDILGTSLVTQQTGPAGQKVGRVYIEEGCEIARELYLSLVIDRATGWLTIMASTEGGVEIEAVAAATPEKILKVAVDPAVGLQPFHARRLAFGLGLEGVQVRAATKLIGGLYRAFTESDASLLEVNPLVVTTDDRVIALDAKMNFDDNALYRHKDIEALRDESEEDPDERAAAEHELNYIRLDGSIGCLVNGAGLAMATMDIIKLYGRAPANFLDVGGGATKERVAEAFKIILADEKVEAILVNIFGGIMRCDVLAEGIVTAARELGLEVPLVVRLEGTNVVRGKAILAESGLAIISADSLGDAAERVVAATKTAA